MCGRYSLALRAGQVRQRLQESNMPAEEAPDDDAFRETYNFAPGYFGLVYRADVPDHGAGQSRHREGQQEEGESSKDESREEPAVNEDDGDNTRDDSTYKLQAMKWGLIPFWTKRQPDYGSMMRTINCRDDSLAQSGGMWTTMKQKKRCIVIAQGFYEWLKKNNGKEKIPHFVKRKDGQLMCFAGLWDCVRYDDSDEKLYTYTIITTDSNKQLGFLHDRMPVILDNGSPDMFRWLDKTQTAWTKELQTLLRPFSGELECYPVPRDVGKVGNNSPSFIVPVDSAENKQNIANFFGNQRRAAAEQHDAGAPPSATASQAQQTGDEANPDEPPKTQDATEPTPASSAGQKRPLADRADSPAAAAEPPSKAAKPAAAAPPTTPSKPKPKPAARPARSATKNASPAKPSPSPRKAGDGSMRITNFFKT